MRPTPILATLAAGIVAALIAHGPSANAKEFRSSDVHPMDYPTVQAVVYMGKIIGEKTGGKYGVKVFGQSALGSEKDTIEQTKIGALDMVRVNVAPFNNIVPSTIVPSLPFLFKSTSHMRKVLDGPVASVAVDHAGGAYAGTLYGVVRSTDGSGSWQRCGLGTHDILGVATGDGGLVVALTADGASSPPWTEVIPGRRAGLCATTRTRSMSMPRGRFWSASSARWRVPPTAGQSGT